MTDNQQAPPKNFEPPKLPQSPLSGFPIVGGILSIVPGLGQFLTGNFMRGFLLFFSIMSLVSLAYWRINETEAFVDPSLFPPSLELVEDLNKLQTEAVTYAVLAMLLTAVGYVWNIYDGFACAEGKPSPARMGLGFITVAMLVIGTNITEIDIRKAINEVGDVGPRLGQILWPWDDPVFLTRDVENIEASANWSVPCDGNEPAPIEVESGQPVLSVTPTCGEGSGERRPDGTRDEGTVVTVVGSNFEADKRTQIYVKAGSAPEFRPISDGKTIDVLSDSDGNFQMSFVMPNLGIPPTAVGTVNVKLSARQEHEVGSLKFGDDFIAAFEGIVVTIFLALMATAVGVVLAVPFSFLAARNLMSANAFTVGVYYIVRLIMNIVRSIEPLVWALIAIIWVGPGPFAGVIALTLHTIAALGKLYSEAIESIDDGPIEAIRATGANSLQTIIYAVIPQVIPPFVSFTIYRWDINVRMSTIIGAVGGGGIGVVLFQWIRLADYNAVGIAVWLIAIVVTILDYSSARIREHYV